MERLLAQGQASRNSLRQVLAKLGEQGKFLLLLVDDYHAALVPNAKYTEADVKTFLSECRSLPHNKERQSLSMIVTSSRPLNELGPPLNPYSSPWYNHYFFQPLKPFTDGEIAALLGETLTPELQQGVRQITGGNPYLLQIVSSLLYQQKEQGTEKPNFEALAKEFESRTDSFFQSIWQLSNEVEQTLMMLLALSDLQGRLHNQKYDLSGINIIFRQQERELRYLEERNVITHRIENGQKVYSFTSSLMERLVIQELANSNDTWLQKRQKILLKIMSRRQTKQVTRAIQWLWQHKKMCDLSCDGLEN